MLPTKFSYIILAFCALAPLSASAQISHELDEVSVTARRPLSEIGFQKTRLDSAALRDNVALSMADVIGFNSSLFVKTSGRATLSTVAFRGASPSHTAVSWNGLPLNSPALGMTDFSLVPAYFIDRADLLLGAAALTRSSGSLGGMVDMSSSPAAIADGWSLQYVQGAGSFTTFDEFLRLSHGAEKWKFSTRAVLSTSKNDFSFLNRDKKVNIYDDNHQIVSQYYPTERNRNGAYRDFHILQQVCFTPSYADRFGLNAWFTGSNREIPLTTVDYLQSRRYENRQREHSLRAVLDWKHSASRWNSTLSAAYVNTSVKYRYGFSNSPDAPVDILTDSRTRLSTVLLNADANWTPFDRLYLTASLSVINNHVRSADHASLISAQGYDSGRTDSYLALNARWQPVDRLGLSVMLRQELTGSSLSPLVPALLADWLLWRPANLTIKASVSRSFRAPTLNDLYFIPGGNPGLKNEKGWGYDLGGDFACRVGSVSLSGSATWFDSMISDWILWLPTNKGFFSPRNVRRVHRYGLESSLAASLSPFSGAMLDLHGAFALTWSVNDGHPLSDGDMSIGQQLPYVPRTSASATASLSWRQWALAAKWCYYSRRYTMTSAQNTPSGSLPSYFMTNMSVERSFETRPLGLSVKLAVNNLFDADYQTIMSHPMPGINFEIFLSLTPHF